MSRKNNDFMKPEGKNEKLSFIKIKMEIFL